MALWLTAAALVLLTATAIQPAAGGLPAFQWKQRNSIYTRAVPVLQAPYRYAAGGAASMVTCGPQPAAESVLLHASLHPL